MGFTAGLVLIAIGAILTFAVDVTSEGIDVNMIGIILMIVGAVALLASIVFWSSWGGFHRREVVDGNDGRRVVDEYSTR